MSSAALEGIRNAPGGTDFIAVMKASLRHSLHQGPSAALLIGLLAALKRKDLCVWANDIEDGHYGNAIPALEALGKTVREILPVSKASLAVSVCSTHYPDSIDDLKATLADWHQDVHAVLGFLDPMRYVRDSRGGPYTSSSDHRRWRRALRGAQTSVAVKFTGNSDAHSLLAELSALRSDLEEIGFRFWLEVRRQHYVVSVGSRTADLFGSDQCQDHSLVERLVCQRP
jgi:hypothetical protein